VAVHVSKPNTLLDQIVLEHTQGDRQAGRRPGRRAGRRAGGQIGRGGR